MLKRGVPPEIVTRLEDLWKATKVIAGEVINVGRIIVIKILEFANENQKKVTFDDIAGMVHFISTVDRDIDYRMVI